jgi:hypothetical protein
MQGPARSSLLDSFPDAHSPFNLAGFFDTLYARYDERFVVSAPDLARTTRRLEWDPQSPGLVLDKLDFPIRSADYFCSVKTRSDDQR